MKDNSSDLFDILPELPTSLRKIVNLINNDQLNLDNNLKKLSEIENIIDKNSRRNYWLISILIFSIFFFIITYLVSINLYSEYIFWYMLIIFILIISLRPKRKGNDK